MSEDRRLAVLRAIVEDYVADPGAGRLQGARRAARPRRLAGDDPQRHGRARGGGAHRPAAHQRRPGADRQGLPALRRPAHHGQAAVAAEKRAIATFLDGAVDLDDVVDRTVRLLAQLTHQVAVVQYPSLTRSTVRHVELVPLGDGRAAGRAHHQHRAGSSSASSTSAGDADDAPLGDLRARLNAAAGRPPAHRGRAAASAPCRRRSCPRTGRSSRSSLDALAGRLVAEREERVVLGGTANLARFGHGLRGIHRAGARGARGARRAAQAARRVAADTGGDRRPDRPREPVRGPRRDRVVATGYGGEGEVVARLGVVGPTRMDYPATMAAVRAVARYVSRILAS